MTYKSTAKEVKCIFRNGEIIYKQAKLGKLKKCLILNY